MVQEANEPLKEANLANDIIGKCRLRLSIFGMEQGTKGGSRETGTGT